MIVKWNKWDVTNENPKGEHACLLHFPMSLFCCTSFDLKVFKSFVVCLYLLCTHSQKFKYRTLLLGVQCHVTGVVPSKFQLVP